MSKTVETSKTVESAPAPQSAAPPDDLDARIARAVANEMLRIATAAPAAPQPQPAAGPATVILLAEKQAQYGGIIFVNVGRYASVGHAWADARVIEARDGCICHVALFLPRGSPAGVTLPVVEEGDRKLNVIDVG
jgi:hypothetical protein